MDETTANDPARLLHDLRQGGVGDERVLAAFTLVDRASFVPEQLRHRAYEDRPLPIGCGQTISQPLVVAMMAEALELEVTDRLLEIGTGSGFACAVFAHLVAEVYSVESQPALAELAARRLLAHPRAQHIQLRLADGTLGWPQAAPFDAIAVAAAGPHLPPALVAQLAPGGRLVMPVGPERDLQQLTRLRRGHDGSLVEDRLGWVRFVPLLGEQGWPAP